MKNVKILIITILVMSLNKNTSSARPLLEFASKKAVRFEKILELGNSEILEFQQPVSLAQYGSSKQSLEYIKLEKLEPSQNGYKKFLITAMAPGLGVLTFRSGKETIKVRITVQENYSMLESKLNKLFGIKQSTYEERIQVISANLVNDLDITSKPRIFLKGKVTNAKSAMLAVAFAANAIGDQGVKIFSNPGGQLRFKDLETKLSNNNQNTDDSQNQSFVEFYESTNKLIDTNNIYRDLILASEEERVISFLEIKEPKRYAVKVRFLEMDTRMIDSFISSISTSSNNNDISGSIGTASIPSPSINQVSGLGLGTLTNMIGRKGIEALTKEVSSGNLISGTVKLLDNVFLNLNINDLINEGALRIVNEFSLITHSGDAVSLGKGTRFPIPQINNSVSNSSVTVEYIPIGFKGELKVTSLENGLIDVQLASRLSAAESSSSSISGISVPIFKEEYVNSGAMLTDGQELILNAFLTESEANVKSTSPLGRIIPFLGSSKKKQRSKNLLFIAIEAQEIAPSSAIANSKKLLLPHINIDRDRNIFAYHNRELEKKNLNSELDLALINNNKTQKQKKNYKNIDALEIEGEL